MKIRSDLVGVVVTGGSLLKAGDDVPEGVSVHPSLLDGDAEPKGDAPEDTEPKGDDFSDMLGDDDEAPAPKAAPKSNAPRRGAAAKKS